MRIPGNGSVIVNCIVSQRDFAEAESELRFIVQHQIKPIYFMDVDYPFRLKQCMDAPMLLYLKGVEKFNLNAKKIIRMVGTREQKLLYVCSVF